MTDPIDDRPLVFVKTQLAYSQLQAAATLGISVSQFQRFVRPGLPIPTYIGSRVVFKHSDLVRWLSRQ